MTEFSNYLQIFLNYCQRFCIWLVTSTACLSAVNVGRIGKAACSELSETPS